MDSKQVGVEHEIDIPVGITPTSLVITHEWGNEETIESPDDPYLWTPDSIGTHKFQWLDGTAVEATQFFDSYMPLITEAKFASDYPTVVLDEGQFALVEQTTRLVIQNYTGQKFGPYKNKSMRVVGDGGDSIFVPTIISRLESIVTSNGDDITEFVEIYPNDANIIHKSTNLAAGWPGDTKRDISFSQHSIFSSRFSYVITGDWGYEYVPQEVAEAATGLVTGVFAGSNAQDLREQGVFEALIGDFKIRLNADQWGTTGNVRSDNLLAPFVVLGIGLI